jgi:Tol biopolymer transport system component/tRNA A-37 threonylcarbamoyl transferase component Bud32
MGEVYCARDTRLGRDVAVKVSSAHFSERFEREARAIAALNHPNICQLYDVGPNYLVMELIDGPTLADRLKDGPVPDAEAASIAIQIAEALDAAHGKGVIHRDLKPGNIKLKLPGQSSSSGSSGTIKVLDFGLAKVSAMAVSASGHLVDVEHSPTISVAAATEAGVVLGTAGYMSPEQARGKTVDKRADIWAFGVVLYEMLTGSRLFTGEDASETLAAVIKEEPDLTRVPARFRPVLRLCLQKDPSRRLHDIADAKLLLDATAAEEAAPKARNRRRWFWAGAAAAVAPLLLAAAVIDVAHLREMPSEQQEVRLQIPQPEGLTYVVGNQAAISPDGRWLAFPSNGSGVSRYYLRALDGLDTKPIPGSEGIIGNAPPPFWSYDSRFVVFGALGKLKKADVTGTPAQAIVDIGIPFVQGGSWSQDGVIIFARNPGSLMRAKEGGPAVPLTVLAQGETAHRWPQFLPDGKRFLYLRASTAEKTGVYLGSIDVKPDAQSMQPLLLTNRQAYWAASKKTGRSYLLFQRDDALLAQPFDTAMAALSGVPLPVANGVGSFGGANSGLWTVARNGDLVYRSGGNGLPQLIARDASGKVETLSDSGAISTPAPSPDGGRIAFALVDGQANQDLWVRDLRRGNNTRLTFDPARDFSPVWSPTGKEIIFASNRAGHSDLYEKNADGSGDERLLLQSDQDKIPTSWSRDGRYLLFHSSDSKSGNDLWVLPLDTLKPFVFLKTDFQEQFGEFSPDGLWIAYMSNVSATPQVFVRAFSGPASNSNSAGAQWMLSTTDGTFPKWSADGKRLFYTTQPGALMAVNVKTGATLESDSPRPVFNAVVPSPWGGVLPDGRFVFAQVSAASGTPPPFTVVLNWMGKLPN